MRDLYHNIEVRRAISPVDVSDDTPLVSQIIDLANVESCVFVVATGTLADAGATWTALLEEGAASDLSDAAAVADADMYGTEAGLSFVQTDDNEVHKLGYRGIKRYVRLTITPAGNASSGPIAAVAVLTHHRRGYQTTQ